MSKIPFGITFCEKTTFPPRSMRDMATFYHHSKFESKNCRYVGWDTSLERILGTLMSNPHQAVCKGLSHKAALGFMVYILD